MAGLFGARLSPFAPVVMLGTWREGLKSLRKDGLRLVESDGQERTFKVRVIEDPQDCAGARMAIVLVKSWQTARVARQLSECLAEDGIALTLQNGAGNLETLQAELGRDRAALGVTTTGATLLGPGRVRAGGVGPTHVAAHPRLKPLIDLLEQAGFEVERAEDIESLVWGKLIINAGINPLTGVLRIPNGELLERADARHLMAAAAREAAAVAASKGVRLPYDDPVRQVEEVARKTASNHSSMYQDVQRGAPTEIDAISGIIYREGSRLGTPTPVNETLWHIVKAMVPPSEPT
jgi:2-dehydropantoate 2-reductase